MVSANTSRSAATIRRKFLPGAREKLLALLSATDPPGDEDAKSAAPAPAAPAPAPAHEAGAKASPPPELWSGVLGVVLESACKQHEWGLATALVRAGAAVGALDLHAAIRAGQEELCRALLENGASASARDKVGQTPLHLASMQGSGAMAELLLQEGASIDAEVGGWTPLSLAAERGSVDVVRVLMAAGADSGVRAGASPLILAADNGHVDALRTIVELGGDVNAAGLDGWTALHSATGKTMVDVLVEAGADIEARDSDDDTALNYLAQYHAIAPMRALVSHGADVNTQNANGDTPLHFAARAAGDQGAAQLVDFLLRSGADETMLNTSNETAADVVGHREHEDDTEENMERVRELLANAPADRAWRRRGLLLLCIAVYPAWSQQRRIQNASGDVPGIDVLGSDSTEPPGGSSVAEEGGDGAWDRVVAWVVGLVEGKEGIFRTIMGFV